MAINQNHVSEELNGVKCAIVEKNVPADRASFLKQLLMHNKYTVEIAASPPPKVTPPVPPKVTPSAAPQEGETTPPVPVVPETFTVGVTDMMFNPVNAIFGRQLHTPDGHVVTLAYWYQRDKSSHDEIPYYNEKKHR